MMATVHPAARQREATTAAAEPVPITTTSYCFSIYVPPVQATPAERAGYRLVAWTVSGSGQPCAMGCLAGAVYHSAQSLCRRWPLPGGTIRRCATLKTPREGRSGRALVHARRVPPAACPLRVMGLVCKPRQGRLCWLSPPSNTARSGVTVDAAPTAQ